MLCNYMLSSMFFQTSGVVLLRVYRLKEKLLTSFKFGKSIGFTTINI